MPDPIIRGPKIPLKWSTTKATGYVIEKFDRDRKTDQVLLEDEDGKYCTEITGLRRHQEITIEVMPLSGLSSPPVEGDIFEYADSRGAVKLSITSMKENSVKSQAIKWTLSGKYIPNIHDS